MPGATVTAVNVATNVTSTTVRPTVRAATRSVPHPRHLFGHRGALRLQESGARERRGPHRRSARARPAARGRQHAGNGVGERRGAVARTRTGSTGQVIDEKRISLMPLSDGNPFVLARLAPGVSFHGDLKFSRPFDNGGTSDFTADGGPGAQRVHARRLAQHGQRPPRCLRPAGRARCRSSRSKRRRSTRSRATPPAPRSTSRSRAAPTAFKGDAYYHYRDESALGQRFLPRAGRRPKNDADYKRLRLHRSAGRWLGKLYDGRNKTFFFGASSGSTTRSPSLASSPCRPRRSAAAISRRCSPRASSSTTR